MDVQANDNFMIRPREEQMASNTLFKHSSLGIIICDQDGNIAEVNPHASSLFGYQSNELIGQKIEVLIPQQFRQKHVGYRTEYSKNPTARPMGISMDLWGLKKDGTEFSVEVSLAPYEVDGKQWYASFISDITERRKVKNELHQLNITLERKVNDRTKELSEALIALHQINENLEMEIAERKRIAEELRVSFEKERELGELKSHFVSLAAHEFRTPLGGIGSSAALIGKYQKEDEQHRREKHVKTIQRLVQHMTSILNDFLSMDKLEQGKVIPKPLSFELSAFVKSCIADYLHDALQEDRISYEHLEKKCVVEMDQEMFRNILINLLSNALKYSPENTTVYIRTESSKKTICLIVEDHGIGIPEQDQKHLYERFYRAKNASPTSGTGIGLSLVKNYLDLMGGSIRFESKEGKGTTFVVELPKEVSRI